MSEKRNLLGHRIAIGLWVDAAGDLHISIPELLAHFGVADTPQNREECMRFAMEGIRMMAPQSVIKRTASCPACDSENCRVTEANEKDKGDFCCKDCLTFFCEAKAE